MPISDLMVKLVNLPKNVQRILAAIFILGTLVMTASALSIIVGLLLQQRDDIQSARLTLGRLERVIEIDRAQDPALSNVQVGDHSEFLDGPNDAVIQAALQSKLNAVSAASGMSVISSGALGPIEKDGLTQLGIRANIEGSLSSVYDTLLQLEMATPYLNVTELTLRAPVGQADAEHEANMSVQLTFTGIRIPRRNGP